MEGAAIPRDRQPNEFRLEPGSHRDPDDGVCIVELASIIAGEPFSDTPRCVCEVIASFLRSWNDRATYGDRQRLLPYAERIIGTAGDPYATERRRDICIAFAGLRVEGGRVRRFGSRLRMRARLAIQIGIASATRLDRGAGEYAARLCFGRDDADTAFDLLDRLLEQGDGERAAGAKPRLPHHWVPAVVPERSGANGNGNGNGHRDELGVRATVIARQRGKTGHGAANGNGRPDGNGHTARRRAGKRAGRR